MGKCVHKNRAGDHPGWAESPTGSAPKYQPLALQHAPAVSGLGQVLAAVRHTVGFSGSTCLKSAQDKQKESSFPDFY